MSRANSPRRIFRVEQEIGLNAGAKLALVPELPDRGLRRQFGGRKWGCRCPARVTFSPSPASTGRDCRQGFGRAVRWRVQRSRRAAVRRHRDGRLLHAGGVQPGARNSDVGALRGVLPRHRGRLRHDMVDAPVRSAEAGRADGVALRPLPGRSPVPLAQRRTGDGSGRDHRQLSARRLRPHRLRRYPVSLPADHPRHQDGAGSPGLGGRSGTRKPMSSCSRATCRSCPTASPPSCRGAASISTIPSCPASRARSPTTRRTSAA